MSEPRRNERLASLPDVPGLVSPVWPTKHRTLLASGQALQIDWSWPSFVRSIASDIRPWDV